MRLLPYVACRQCPVFPSRQSAVVGYPHGLWTYLYSSARASRDYAVGSLHKILWQSQLGLEGNSPTRLLRAESFYAPMPLWGVGDRSGYSSVDRTSPVVSLQCRLRIFLD